MSPTPRPLPVQPAHDHTTTRLETDDDVLKALRRNLKDDSEATEPLPTEKFPSSKGGRKTRPKPSSRVALFRPTLRPPMAVLTVFDDGKTEGETFRLRDGRFVIGREEGNLVIPHDGRISSQHVEIARQEIGGQQRWVLNDLQSTNGLFVRVLRTPLIDRDEFLVGKGPLPVPGFQRRASRPDSAALEKSPNSTQGWEDDDVVIGIRRWPNTSATPLVPACRWCILNTGSARIPSAVSTGQTIRSAILAMRGSFVTRKHGWQIENNTSVNGVWFRLSQVVVESNVQFQIGEQRLKLQVGG